MSKITCDICGTTYAETAPCCPICGYSRNPEDGIGMEDLLQDEEERGRGGRYSFRKKEIFDYDEVNAESYEDPQESFEEDEGGGSNTLIVVILTVLIAVMLIAAGFIFARFYLPGLAEDPTIPTAATVQTESTIESTSVPTVPCEELVMSSGATAQLSAEGQHFLLHVQAKPENTTDKIIYTSGDESVATVSEDGRITAVSEGETIIFIACGVRTLECPVVVRYVADTTPPEIDITPPAQITAEDVDSTEPSQATEADPRDPTAGPLKDVELKLKKTDVQLGAYLQFTLELDCELTPEEVEWTSVHPYIATVNEKGVVTSIIPGTTIIRVTYGDQTAECIVRCIK